MEKERIRILLVEDDEDDYVITRDLLSDIDSVRYDLKWVMTYDAALEEMGRNQYDVFLFDYRLGERTGLDLLREVTHNGCNIPAVLLTGQGGKEIDLEAMKAGAMDYLVKGKTDFTLLERTIRYAIERKRAEEQIKQLAYYDHLTNLPNRVLFQEQLKQAIANYSRTQKAVAIMFLDLDNFKRINDTLGHNAGDQLLKGVASRLNGCLRKSDALTRPNISNTVGRQGGDEFTILLPEITDCQAAVKVAQRILTVLSQPYILEGHEVVVTTSIGIALYPHDGEDINMLLMNADAAMYHAKNKGKNNFQFYSRSMNAAALERLNLEIDLRNALERGEFVLYYQPRMEIRTGKIIGMEALIHWQHPDKGTISPAEFIPVAEETGLIIPIGEWVLRTACNQSKGWQKGGITPIRVSVSLSGQQLKQENLIKTVIHALETSGLDKQYLELEITEGIIMQDRKIVIGMLQAMKDRGLWLSMDNFGMGHSSLRNLKSIPLDILKIDRSFVKDIITEPADTVLVSAIIAMAKSLKLRLLAEGVETEQQLAFLREQGCEEIQGNLVSRPLSAEEALRFLADHSPLPARTFRAGLY